MSAGNLHRIFYPKSIAVFGEGDKEVRLADIVVNNIVSAGFKGRVFSICSEATVNETAFNSDDEEADNSADLGIIAAPTDYLLKAIQTFGKLKTAGVIISSEANLTTKLYMEILEYAKSVEVRLIGPRSWGILNSLANLSAALTNLKAFPGELAVISQSSSICATLLDLSVTRKIGIGFLIGLGDMIDIDFADVINYMSNDVRVRAILLHVASLRNLRKFVSASRAAARIKPVIVLKTSRHQSAFSIIKSPGMNTVNDISIYDAAFKRAGIIRVETIEDLFDCAEFLSKKVRPTGHKLVIISEGKTPGVMAEDALRDYGVLPLVLNDKAAEDLDMVLYGKWNRDNPICTQSELTPEIFEKIISSLAASTIDGILLILSPQRISDPRAFACYLSETASHIKIPLFVAWMGGDSVDSSRKILNAAGISTNETPERAVRAFMSLYTYAMNQRLLQEIPLRNSDFACDLNSARRIIDSAIGSLKSELSAFEASDLLESYGFPIKTPQCFGFKEDNSPETNRTVPNIQTYTINIIVGSRMIPDFGPVLFLGPDGGISKIIKDWAIGLPPLNHTLARHMLLSSPILVRLFETNNRDSENYLKICEELIIRLSHLVTDFAEISAIDMDVSMFSEEQAVVTKSKVIIEFSSMPSPLHLIISPYPNQYETYATTKNGWRIFIRPIKPEDAELLQQLWSTFSPRTLYNRFSKQKNELSPDLLVSLTQIDYDREIALVAIHHSEFGEKMLGVGRLYGDIGADISEFSVVVGDPWQGLGIGAQLLSHLICIAKERKIKKIWGLIQVENKNMIDLARNLNFSIIYETGDPQVEAMLTINT